MDYAAPLAIFGGTFDPVHLGHLRVAWEVSETLDAVVHLMPAADPAHREAPGATAAQRLAMLQLALRGQSRLIADDRELRRTGATYTIDTIESLRGEVGDDRSLVLLIGADAFSQFSTWKRWRDILALAHIGVLTRPGHGGVFEAELAAEWYERRTDDVARLREQPAGAILPIEVTPIELSATVIREQLAQGREPRFLLPDAVLDYIVAHDLYRD